MAISALPTPPSTSDPSTFATKADALLSALPDFVTEANALQTDVNDKQVTVSDAAIAAIAAQVAAEAASSASKWVSGTTYGEGDVTWSPITFKSFRRKITGAGATDPSLDSTNWAELPLTITDQAEAEGGVENTKYMSSLRVKQSITANVPSASDTVSGKVELATTAETITTDATRAVTPAGYYASTLGIGQTWQDVTGSRSAGTTYTNSTGRPIQIIISSPAIGTSTTWTLTIAGVVVSVIASNTGNTRIFMSAIIPNGATYSLTVSGTGLSIWSELR